MKKEKRTTYIVAGVCLIAIIVLIVGIVLIVKSTDKDTSSGSKEASDRYKFSNEALSSGFAKFLQKVQDSDFEVFPEAIVYKPNVTVDEIKRVFKPFDSSWKNLKKRTDTAKELLDEVKDLTINTNKLKPREKKALFRIKHYLQFNFAVPYDGNYYAGDYMMGPNLFCWQPICGVPSQVASLRYFQPKEVKDLEVLQDKLALFNQTYHSYIQNLKDGIKAGMVRSVEECKAGLDAIKRTAFKVALNGPEGILKEGAVQDLLSPNFLKHIMSKSEDLKKWEQKHEKSVNESVREFLVDYVGKPLDNLFKYLENDFSQYCVPSNISSGLANLPLSYIYKNGKNTGTKTTKKLPSGEDLDGKKSYDMIMPYFTTNNMTADEVWRALRLIVDTGLHNKGFSREKALKFFADYAWDTSDGASKEVTRYQSDPGQATAYMVGQLHIIKLREYATKKLGKKFNLKDFHFYLLSQGSAPLSYLDESISRYVECTLNNGKGDGCHDVLYPVGNDDKTTASDGIFDDTEWGGYPPERYVPYHYI
ncbi:uncharacterized protein LOC110252025 [Exaiptasia diaphana]|uniref:Uncharacterized protein n=1 Tax=Exaiptasia diaphana TaxID=2652724 RepID=A0A913Y5G4_EXADI|nr:uncharacterized protein LOC110252025 [Exaiptasia diaphana]KXJ22647.1 hypothetical protein AC249_AIPGENE26594 [Exaiptasia diaphana]